MIKYSFPSSSAPSLNKPNIALLYPTYPSEDVQLTCHSHSHCTLLLLLPPTNAAGAGCTLAAASSSFMYLTTAGGSGAPRCWGPCSVGSGDWYCGHLPYQSPHLHFCKWEREQFTCHIGVPATQNYKVAVPRTTPVGCVLTHSSSACVSCETNTTKVTAMK